MRRVYKDVIDLLLHDKPTPMVRINRLVHTEGVEVYAKLEWFNPFGSIKDRPVYWMVRELLEREQPPEVLEATSGNTGIALAGLYAHKAKVTLLVPEDISEEKLLLMRLLGAQVRRVRVREEELIKLAEEEARNSGALFLNQFGNELNVQAHFETTGPEIWEQTEGRVTHVVAGMGTAGTIIGIGRYLKSKNPKIKVIGVIPAKGDQIPGLTDVEASPPKIYDPKLIDEVIRVSYTEALATCLRIIREERILAGISSGAAMFAAMKLIERGERGLFVVIFPDSITRYLSTLRALECLGLL